jgi:phosphoglycerate kinase
MNKLTLDRLDVDGKRVFVRVDFNVPLGEDGAITDDERIVRAIPTIKHLVEANARVVLASHLGRPKGKRDESQGLAPVAKRLSEALAMPVALAPDCVGPETEKAVAALKPGQIILLENLRFHAEEEANDPAFLARLGDAYVNDAFGAAHRAHASTEGITKHFPGKCAAGLLMQQELEYLHQKLFERPQRPLVAILGGAKVSGKIEVIEHLIDHVDTLLIGGGMAYTFLKAQGGDIGDSLFDEATFETAKKLLERFKACKAKVLLPADTVGAGAFSPDAKTQVFVAGCVPDGWMGLDIGPETAAAYKAEIATAKTVVWNGPMGVFEMDKFAEGTRVVAEALAENPGVTIIGGGDTAAAVAKLGLSDKMSHVSTGGGASLEFMAGAKLPGVEALTDA